MRTLIILVGGIVLLLVFVAIARVLSKNDRAAMSKAALAFVPVWLMATGYNLWIGVTEAGYSIAEETPILLLLFGLPGATAFYLWRRLSR